MTQELYLCIPIGEFGDAVVYSGYPTQTKHLNRRAIERAQTVDGPAAVGSRWKLISWRLLKL